MDKLKLAMLAGAYAIRNNKKLECGEYVYNVFEKPESISWRDAEKYLVCAVSELSPEECEIEREIIKPTNGYNSNVPYERYTCSCCSYRIKFNTMIESMNYCPKCGAMIKGIIDKK